jgi:hypothetical protein
MKLIRYKKMNAFQKRIYDGLLAIGPEIGNFYLDGVRMMDASCTLASKANLIAHMAREIDSSFRDVFAPQPQKKAKETELGGNKGHYASILVALGREKDDSLADNWFAIATEFPKIAHHKAAHLPSKGTEDIERLWTEYEKVLSLLVGSFYGIADRLKLMASLPEPDSQVLQALKNMLRDPTKERYFFLELKQVAWLAPLEKEGYFAITKAPSEPVGAYGAHRWPALTYLMTVAPMAKNDTTKKTYVRVINEIAAAYLADQLYLDEFMMATMAHILLEAPELSFTRQYKQLFDKACTVFNSAHLFYTSTLSEQLPRKILDQKNNESLKNLLAYLVGFYVYSDNAEDLKELGYSPVARIAENVDVMHLDAFSKTYGREMVHQLKGDAIRIVLAEIDRVNDMDPMKLSPFTIPSIEPSDQSRFATDWENKLVDILADFLLHLERPELPSLIQELIYSPLQILTRIAFHVIRTKFDELSDIFWSFISSTKLNDDIYIHEPYLLIEQKSAHFTDSQFESLLLWIESREKTSFDGQSAAEIDRDHYRTIRRWLTALQPSDAQQIEKLDQTRAKYDAKESSPISHPSFTSYFTVSSGYDSPVEPETFDQMTVEDQAKYCAEFKQKDAWDTSEEGLSTILSNSISKNPFKYYYSLDLFADLGSLYIYNILYGFLNAIRNGLLNEYSLLVAFVERKVNSAGFQQEEEGKLKARNWVVGAIADLFGAIVTRRDLFQFTKEDLQLFNSILIRLLEDERFRDHSDMMKGDVATHVLNSTPVKLHRALIDSELVWADLYSQGKDAKWSTPVRDYFSGRLQEIGKADKDFFLATGFYLNSILFLDKEWVDKHYPLLFDTGKETHLKYTLLGCFSIYQQIIPDLYDFFKAHDTFRLGLSASENTNSSVDLIMRYSLWEWRFRKIGPDDLTSLLKYVIDKRNEGHVLRLIQVIKDFHFLTREQLIVVWKLILGISNEDQQRFKDVFYSLIAFIDVYGQLDKEVPPLIADSIKHFTEIGPASNYLVRLLCKYGVSNLEMAADLLYQLIRTINAIPYVDDDLRKLIESFYKNNVKEQADAICLFFADKGSLFLKDLYDNYSIPA